MTADDRTMLALAALTYRGFASQSEARIAEKLRARLTQLETDGLGRWSLVWGPEAFRGPASFVHDAMAYVAREEGPAGVPPRYAVAIRGTNPVSLFDWLFGDFWVSQPLAWPGATPADARLSGSTLLGLEVIRRLGGEEDGALPAALTSASRDFSDRLLGLTFERLLAPRSVHGLSSRIGELIARFAPPPDGSGATLRAFFAALPTGARVAVTGHSKGGALAVATALWLHEELASSRDLSLECFSFAGPTAGNAGFARRYAALAPRTRRIVNPLDLVPHAWNDAELRKIAKVYTQLSPAIEALAGSVESLEYAHVGQALELEPRPAGLDLHREIVHQHLDAYLRAARLPAERWSAQAIFLGDDG